MLSSRWMVLLAGAFVAGAACGGRTGEELLDGYGGAIGGDGASSGFGGSTGSGSSTASGGKSSGGKGGGIGGAGGKVTGGRPGSGGFGGNCTTASCDSCDSCFDRCLCGWDFDPSYARNCQVACFGSAGGGPATGGFPGTGAFPGTGGFCGGGECLGSGTASSDFSFFSCCGPAGSCGWYSDPSSAIQTLGCFSPEWGPYDSECPTVNNRAGCCRGGLCGVDLNAEGLGCVPATLTQGYKCDGVSSGTGGFPGTGGFVGTGGFIGTGGVIGSGGLTGTGGKATGGSGGGGTGPTQQQCVAQARSECETCACKSCFESFVACFQDEGCPFILQCANLTGCTGPDCLNPNTCASVIAEHGGIGGPAVQRALPLFSCISTSGCSCGFGR